MKRVVVTSIVVLVAVLSFVTLRASTGAETCFYKSDKTDGQNRICYYSCPSGQAAITVKSHQVCPNSIKR